MTTDNKTLADECNCPNGRAEHLPTCASLRATLADVQPGGRVRLGDQLVLAKLVGAAGLMLAEIDTCGHEVDPAYRHTLYEAWEEGKAALSAQPSPGGPDALVQEALEYFERAGDAGDRKYVAAIRSALAARQPVGEPVGWYTDDHLTDRSATTYDRTVAERWRAKGWPVSPLYAAPPAQAVDLGQFRPFLVESRDRWNDYGHTMRMAGKSTSEAERKVGEASRLIALIDSQAVGK